jgi:RHS repeat-associated protein
MINRIKTKQNSAAWADRRYELLCIVLSLLLGNFATSSVSASDDFDYEVMARTGQDGLTGIKSAPSINKHGHVAFIGNLPGDSLFFSKGVQAINISPSYVGRNFATALQLVDDGTIVARDASATQPTDLKIRLWKAGTPDENYPIVDPTDTGPARVCLGGRRGGEPCASEFDCLNWDNMTFSGCIGVNRTFLTLLFAAMNNSRQIVFQGVVPGFTSPTNLLVTTGPWGTSSNKLDARTDNIRPVIADNGFIIGRAGNASSSPLRLYFVTNQQPLQFVREIAGPATGFSAVGQAPGISDDGGIVGFYGDFNGPGIFSYYTDSNTIMRVARPLTGNPIDLSPVSSFVADNRVVANKSGLVAFLGFNRSSQKAIFVAHSKSTTNSEPLVEEVIAVGDTITNLTGTVADLAMTDGLNDQGDIAFLATMSDGTKAIVKASEKPCKECKCRVGQCELAVSSIDLKIGLGNAVGSSRTAYLKIAASTPSASLSTPAALSLSSGSGLARVLTSGALRQVRSGAALADIVVENDYRYHVRFYTTFTGPNAGGIYAPSGAPFSTVTVENPDGAAAFNRLRIVQNGVDLGTYTYSQASDMWELVTGFGNATRKESVTQSSAAGLRTLTRLIKDGGENVLSRNVSTYQTFAWGEELIETREGPEPNTKVTTYTYYTAPTNSPNYAHLRKVTYPDGRWEFYKEYDAVRGLAKSVSQFQNNPYVESSTWPDPNNRSTEVSFNGPIETRTEFLKGRAISRRWQVDHQIGETWSVVATDPSTESYVAPSNLITRTFTFTTSNTNGAKAGQTSRVINPDGTMSLYAYFNEMQTDPANTGGPKVEINRTVTWSGAANAEFTQVIDGTISEEATDVAGNLLSRREWDIASRALTGSQLVTARDEFGRATRTDYLDGTYVTRNYGCCGLTSETDREGNLTTYNADHVVNLDLDGSGTPETYYGSTVNRAGISTHTLTDPLGRAFKTILQGTNGALIVQDERHYNAFGELEWSKDAMGRQTSYSETIQGGFIVRTTTFPDGSQSVQSSYQDGSPYETRGNAVQGLRYSYEMVQDNGVWVQKNTQTRLEANGALSGEYTATYTDFAGRAYKTEYPWPDGPGPVFSRNAYNSKGQLARSTDADNVTTLYQYNGSGELEVTAVDLDGNGLIDFDGTDRITRTRTSVSGASPVLSVPARITTTEVWETNGVGQSTQLQTGETSADGLYTATTQYGLTSYVVTEIDRSNQRRTVTSYNPDNSYSITVYQRGHQSSITRYDANGVRLRETTFAYDAFGRLRSETDARNGATTYAYYNDDQIHTVTTPDPDPARSGLGYDPQSTTYTYFRDPVNGIKTVTTLPDNGVVTQEFFPSGQLKKTWGARTYPAEYTYDRAGRIKTLKTWQQFNFTTGTGISGDALTTWNYNARGLLANKRYVDNKGPGYTYTAGGKLKTRLWARGVLTTYHFDDPTGDLRAITYSDNTPAVTNTYDRRGRLHVVQDASGSRTLDYTAGQLTDESYTEGMFAGFKLHRGLDSLHRLGSLSVSNQGRSVYHVSHGYDDGSRLKKVTSGPTVAAYTYHPDSDLVHTLLQSHSNQLRLTTIKLYDKLNRLLVVSNVPSADSPVSFDYRYNQANQRTQSTLANGEYWTYGYDLLGQVTNGTKRFPNGSAIPSYGFGYQFDHIGNRLLAIRDGRVDRYTNNLLNQIASIDQAAYLHVQGQVNSNAVLSVNGQTPTRTGPYFYSQLPATGIWNTVTIQGRRAGQGVNGTDALGEESGHLFNAGAGAALVHDDDGNLISDERWNYTWDGENRLAEISTRTNLFTFGVPRIQIGFANDSHGRRIARTGRMFESTTQEFREVEAKQFLYDGTIPLVTLGGAQRINESLAWGTDLSGSAQGASGVGGLLSVAPLGDSGDAWLATSDGGGNVSSLASGQNGLSVAHYEYGVFGEMLRSAGSASEGNRLRFSSKYSDDNTGFSYFGARHYRPAAGSWLSRDPINEAGGAALYAFAKGSPVNSIDPNGLYGRDIHGYFTYFAALAAGTHYSHARSLGLHTWAPDASRRQNAIGVLFSDPRNSSKIQTHIHALTGGAPESVRDMLSSYLYDSPVISDVSWGLFSHLYQDSFSHTVVRRTWLTWLLGFFNNGIQYQPGSTLYPTGIGHGLDGTIPDRVSARRALFLEMGQSYYGLISYYISANYGNIGMSSEQFGRYTKLISEVSDSKREEFIKYVVRCPKSKNDTVDEFDKILKQHELQRLGLDNNNSQFMLPHDMMFESLEDLAKDLSLFGIR